MNKERHYPRMVDMPASSLHCISTNPPSWIYTNILFNDCVPLIKSDNFWKCSFWDNLGIFSRKCHVMTLKYSIFSVFLIIHQLQKFWLYVSFSSQGRVQFWVYLLKHNPLVMKLGRLINKVTNKRLRKI